MTFLSKVEVSNKVQQKGRETKKAREKRWWNWNMYHEIFWFIVKLYHVQYLLFEVKLGPEAVSIVARHLSKHSLSQNFR